MQPYLRDEPWTFDETIDLPDGLGLRYEVVDGVLVVGPPMTVPHQKASLRLVMQLGPQLAPEWEVVHETGIKMGDDGRKPDGGIVRRDAPAGWHEMGLDASGFVLVIEVVSRSSRKNDRFLKPAEYAAAGVPAFWRLEPDPEPRLHVMQLVGDAYQEVQRLTGRGRVSVPFDLEVDLDALF